MSSNDDKSIGKSGPVEVVADRGQDGSFEIRLSRHEEAGVEPPIAAPVVEDSVSYQATSVRAEPQGLSTQQRVLFGAAGVGLLLLLIVAMTYSPAKSERPRTVAVTQQAEFRGYVVSTQAPARARAVQVNFAADDDGDRPLALPSSVQDDEPSYGSFDAGIQARGVVDYAPAPPARRTAEEIIAGREEALDQLRQIVEAEAAARAERNASQDAAVPAAAAPVQQEVVEDLEEDEYLEDDYLDDEYDE